MESLFFVDLIGVCTFHVVVCIVWLSLCLFALYFVGDLPKDSPCSSFFLQKKGEGGLVNA